MTLRYKRPDRKNAASILAAAELEMRFTLSMEPREDAGTTIVRNIYECFRMLGDALLVSEGVESNDHLAPLQRLMELQVEAGRPLRVLDNLRRLRHNVNYYGYRPNLYEVMDALSIAKALFNPLLAAVRAEVERRQTLS